MFRIIRSIYSVPVVCVYATKHRPRTITTCEPLCVISIKHRIVLPEDGSYDPKHVGVNFSVLFTF
jgi:hypothetical protein